MSTEVENWAKKYEDLNNGDETIKAMAILHMLFYV